ncbi:MAG: hypothetical protein RQ885_13495 [Desulfurococcales archaeon]|jgi:hypothetical protein|nr:hypothetical protein [Desulfurococcales archaeon]
MASLRPLRAPHHHFTSRAICPKRLLERTVELRDTVPSSRAMPETPKPFMRAMLRRA